MRRNITIVGLCGIFSLSACADLELDELEARAKSLLGNEKKGRRSVEWDSTKTLREEGAYENGDREGWWGSFFDDQKESEVLYKDGRMVARRTFDDVDRDEIARRKQRSKGAKLADIAQASQISWTPMRIFFAVLILAGVGAFIYAMTRWRKASASRD